LGAVTKTHSQSPNGDHASDERNNPPISILMKEKKLEQKNKPNYQ